MEFDNYGSHVQVFKKIFESVSIESVLEFGLGMHSTTFFADNSKYVLSIEQESEQWHRKMVSQVSSANWHHRFEADPEVIFDYIDNAGSKFDMVFSDGMAQTRCLVANLAMRRSIPFVVLHDAEKIWYYKWNLLEIPEAYLRFDFRCCNGSEKVTAILTNRRDIGAHNWKIPEHERIVQAHISPTQPTIQFSFNGDIRMLTPKGLEAVI